MDSFTSEFCDNVAWLTEHINELNQVDAAKFILKCEEFNDLIRLFRVTYCRGKLLGN